MPSRIKRNAPRRALPPVVAVALALAAAACNGESATGAAAPTLREARVVATDATASVPLLTRAQPLLRDVSYSVDITGNGGTINIPEAGLQIRVPAGAFTGKKPVRFTVTAVAGDVIAYKFGPHGMKFLKPLIATQDLSFTTYDVGGNELLAAGYFPSDADLDVSRRSANISEVFPTAIATGNKVRWDIPHFSGYVIATGRTTR
jgi:hypothetical protein